MEQEKVMEFAQVPKLKLQSLLVVDPEKSHSLTPSGTHFTVLVAKGDTGVQTRELWGGLGNV